MQTEEAPDPLQGWFNEQDRLLDDILIRLAHIEILVGDIHRLITRLPNPVQAAPVPKQSMGRAFDKTPTAPAPASASITANLIDWAPPLAGGGLLILFLLWRSRRRTSKEKVATTTPPAVPSTPAFPQHAPEKSPSPHDYPHAAPPLAPPATATPPVAPASVSIPSTTTSAPPGDQAIELAEIMLSMGLGRGAAQTLAEQIRHQPKQALRQWLKLLEIYRQNGQQAEFERSAEELRQHFNVQPEDWQARPESYRSVEDYPHIAARLTELWRKPSCLNYLGNLLDDNRGGARAGFPQTVAEELLLLTAMLRADGIVAEADAVVDAA